MKAKFFVLAIMAILALAVAVAAVSPAYTLNFAPKVKAENIASFFGQDSSTIVFVKASSSNKVTYSVTKVGTRFYDRRTTAYLDVMVQMPDKSQEQLYLLWNKLAMDPTVSITTNSASKFVMDIDDVSIRHVTRTYVGGTQVYEVTEETFTGPVTITYYKNLKKMDIVGPNFALLGIKAY